MHQEAIKTAIKITVRTLVLLHGPIDPSKVESQFETTYMNQLWYCYATYILFLTLGNQSGHCPHISSINGKCFNTHTMASRSSGT